MCPASTDTTEACRCVDIPMSQLSDNSIGYPYCEVESPAACMASGGDMYPLLDKNLGAFLKPNLDAKAQAQKCECWDWADTPRASNRYLKGNECANPDLLQSQGWCYVKGGPACLLQDGNEASVPGFAFVGAGYCRPQSCESCHSPYDSSEYSSGSCADDAAHCAQACHKNLDCVGFIFYENKDLASDISSIATEARNCANSGHGYCHLYISKEKNLFIHGTKPTEKAGNPQCYKKLLVQDRQHHGWFMKSCNMSNPCRCANGQVCAQPTGLAIGYPSCYAESPARCALVDPTLQPPASSTPFRRSRVCSVHEDDDPCECWDWIDTPRRVWKEYSSSDDVHGRGTLAGSSSAFEIDGRQYTLKSNVCANPGMLRAKPWCYVKGGPLCRNKFAARKGDTTTASPATVSDGDGLAGFRHMGQGACRQRDCNKCSGECHKYSKPCGQGIPYQNSCAPSAEACAASCRSSINCIGFSFAKAGQSGVLECDSHHQGNCVTYSTTKENVYIDGTTQNEANYECYAVGVVEDRAHRGWYMASCNDFDGDDKDDPCECVPWAQSPQPQFANMVDQPVGCADPTGSGDGRDGRGKLPWIVVYLRENCGRNGGF